MSRDDVVLAIGIVFFFGAGIIAVAWPERIRDWLLSFHESGSGLAKWNPFLGWMRTPSYIVSLRLVGALSIGLGCIVVWALIEGRS